jgi:hypothetical protein
VKRVISLVLVLVVMLGCVGLIACGGGEGETAQPAPEEPQLVRTFSPGIAINWGDMPVYPDALKIQEGNWEIPTLEQQWARVEWRYYETEDSTSMVADFYKSQMYGKGWTKRGWVEIGEISSCAYSKNNAMDGAFVWISPDNEKTILALMRGSLD